MANLAQIYDWFMTGKKPTQAQFWASWGSFWNKEETIPQSAITNLTTVLNAKTEKDQFDAHKVAADAHADLFLGKEDKDQKGAANGYAPLDATIKIASEYLNIVNDLVSGGATSLASAETVKTLKTQINAINVLLTSDNVNLDTVQEIVDAIETVQLSLSTILVNDLTTGGTTKALTAEMGKILKGLIDALTTLVGNKVDKVAGERLINAAEITKLAGLGSIATTVKPILSTALASQNVAGFVTYINALNPVLVVGASEIVKYNLTDTGRVFELNLRGRSFGVGQPAIVAADVLEVTDFLNKDIRFSNYPSTRNDGVNPSNKFLGTDAYGNLKNYGYAVFPQPYLEDLVPDSNLPSTTSNFQIYGDYFTPKMCNRILNPNAIIFEGQTVGSAVFHNSKHIEVVLTTNASEGMFDLTLDNGIAVTFPNVLLIVLGVVTIPDSTNMIRTSGDADIGTTAGDIITNNIATQSIIDFTPTVDMTKNWSIYFQFQRPISQLIDYRSSSGVNSGIDIINATTSALLFKIFQDRYYALLVRGAASENYGNITLGYYDTEIFLASTFRLKYYNGVFTLFRNTLQGSTVLTSFSNYTDNVKIKFKTIQADLIKLKYVVHP